MYQRNLNKGKFCEKKRRKVGAFLFNQLFQFISTVLLEVSCPIDVRSLRPKPLQVGRFLI